MAKSGVAGSYHHPERRPEHAKSFGLEKAGGALITSVEKDGPAGRAGLQIGDIILKLNGKSIAITDELIRAVSDAAPGSIIKLQVWRDGAAKELTASLGEAEEADRMRRNRSHGTRRSSPDNLAWPCANLRAMSSVHCIPMDFCWSRRLPEWLRSRVSSRATSLSPSTVSAFPPSSSFAQSLLNSASVPQCCCSVREL